jgi:hypothetical protein
VITAEGEGGCETAAGGGRGGDSEAAAELDGPLPHRSQPDSRDPGEVVRTAAVVLHVQDEGVALHGDPDPAAARVGVTQDVRDRLQDDAVGRDLDGGARAE